MAAALLLASVPAITVVIAPNSAPAFTIDICHPLQSLDSTPTVSLVAIAQANLLAHSLVDRGALVATSATPDGRAPEAPDPPPPKLPA